MNNTTNYNKISTDKAKSDSIVEKDETILVTDENEDALIESKPDVTDEQDYQVTNSSVLGFVCNCERLNVRKNPTIDSRVICVINKGTEVEIDEAASTDEFYKVRSTSETEGFYGYCMKKYIEVLS